MCLKLCLAFLMLLIGLVQGKIVFLPDDKIEDCSKPGEKAGYYDLSKVEIVIETDTEIFINGTVLFLEEVTGPWKTHVYTEQYVRSKWVPAVVEKKVPDLCSSLHKPNEAWYNHLKDQTGCPIPKGAEWKFNMVQITNFQFPIPPTMVGKWRLTTKNWFPNTDKSECTRFYIDVVEM